MLEYESSSSLSCFPERGPKSTIWPNSSSECIHDLFESQAEKRPHAIAVAYQNTLLTYAELNGRANQLAHRLKLQGVGPESLVAICLERSLDAVVAILAILKAGGAYVPLDPAYPAERISYVLSDSCCRWVITDQDGIGHIPSGNMQVLTLDFARADLADLSRENLGPIATPGNLAYVIYTSGSTGKPKGVQVEHRNVVNFLHSMQREPGIDEHDIVAAVTTLCFDIAGLEIHLPLATGARIAIVSREEAIDGTKLRACIEQQQVTLMQATPATWRLLLQAGWPGDKNLKVLCGGEAFPGDLASELIPRCKSLWNMYGPTETTIWSAVYPVTKSQANIPVGQPIANTHFHMADENMHAVPFGDAGELLIGGEGLARGYLNRPELTAEKFVADPFCGEGDGRLYKTGDLAHYLPDGNVAYLGRLDHQVKIRGYRIELGEIEFVLANHPAVKQCVVAAREDLPGEKRLVVYIVPAQGEKLQAGGIRSFLQQKLPEYMVPAAFVVLDAMPLTPNGKVDRKTLPAPTRENSALGRLYVPPRDGLEKELASIFEHVLRIQPIGITDNVFELGVDSLLTAQLFTRIEKRLMKSALRPGSLFQAPTIETLAALLRGQQTTAANWTSLLPIQPHGTKRPLFCVHGAAGTVLGFYPLARRLAPHRPVYGLQNQGLFGRDVPHSTVEEMAAHYIKEIRTVQPHGPYLLAGWCFGGILIFEIAQQLQRMGEQVELLAMLNAASTPEFAAAPAQTDATLAPLATRVHQRWAEFRSLSIGRKLEFTLQKIQGRMNWRFADLRMKTHGMTRRLTRPIRQKLYGYYLRRRRPMPEFLRKSYFFMINGRAERQYRHQPYPGDVVLFRDRGPYADPNMGWGRFVRGNIETYEMPVNLQNYRAMMQEPTISAVAEKIEQYISRRRAQPMVRSAAAEPRAS
jgi:amino acid adenylation domain-containing protein